MSKSIETISFTSIQAKEDCDSERDEGLCRAAFTRFYFDKTDKKCKKFIYGGCGGNKNNYKTKTDCLEACSGGIGKHQIHVLTRLKTLQSSLPDKVD